MARQLVGSVWPPCIQAAEGDDIIEISVIYFVFLIILFFIVFTFMLIFA